MMGYYFYRAVWYRKTSGSRHVSSSRYVAIDLSGVWECRPEWGYNAKEKLEELNRFLSREVTNSELSGPYVTAFNKI